MEHIEGYLGRVHAVARLCMHHWSGVEESEKIKEKKSKTIPPSALSLLNVLRFRVGGSDSSSFIVLVVV
jgi:hypothetical protein